MMYAPTKVIRKIRKCIGKGKTESNRGCHTMFFENDSLSWLTAIDNLNMKFGFREEKQSDYVWSTSHGDQTIKILLRIPSLGTPRPDANRWVTVVLKDNES